MKLEINQGYTTMQGQPIIKIYITILVLTPSEINKLAKSSPVLNFEDNNDRELNL
jgi:hypothetical protein